VYIKVLNTLNVSWLAEPGLKVSSELVASVQSLVAVLQQQIDTSGHRDDAADAPEVTGDRLPDNVGKILKYAADFLVFKTTCLIEC